jgi:hypothetical protein
MASEYLHLNSSDLRALAADVIDRTSAKPFGVYVFASDEPGAELARHVERAVFQEAFGNSPDLLAREYGPYDRSSLFFCVVDHRRRLPAGMMRVILPSDATGPGAGSKSVHDLERVWGEPADEVFQRSGARLDRDRVWDVATLAVGADYRTVAARGLVSLALNQALIVTLGRYGIRQVVTILDLAVLRLLQWQLGKPFSMLRGLAPMPYLGSGASVPVWSDLVTWRPKLAHDNPTIYDLLFEGRGIEAAVGGADWETVVQRVASVGGGSGSRPEPAGYAISLDPDPLAASMRSSSAGTFPAATGRE